MFAEFFKKLWQKVKGFCGFKRTVLSHESATLEKNLHTLHSADSDEIEAQITTNPESIRQYLDLVQVENKQGSQHIDSLQNHKIKRQESVTALVHRFWFSGKRVHIGDSLLFSAARYGHFGVFSKLLSALDKNEKSFYLNLRDREGNTALMLMADIRAVSPPQVTNEPPKKGKEAYSRIASIYARLGLETEEVKASKAGSRKSGLLQVFETFTEAEMPILIEQLHKKNQNGETTLQIAVKHKNTFYIEALLKVMKSNLSLHDKKYENDWLDIFLESEKKGKNVISLLLKEHPSLAFDCLNSLSDIVGEKLYERCLKNKEYDVAIQLFARVASIRADFVLNALSDPKHNAALMDAIFNTADKAFFEKLFENMGEKEHQFFKLKVAGLPIMIRAVKTNQSDIVSALLNHLPAGSEHKKILDETAACGSALQLAFSEASLDIIISLLEKLAEVDPEKVVQCLSAPLPTGKDALFQIGNRRDMQPEAFIQFFNKVLALTESVSRETKLALFKRNQVGELVCRHYYEHQAQVMETKPKVIEAEPVVINIDPRKTMLFSAQEKAAAVTTPPPTQRKKGVFKFPW